MQNILLLYLRHICIKIFPTKFKPLNNLIRIRIHKKQVLSVNNLFVYVHVCIQHTSIIYFFLVLTMRFVFCGRWSYNNLLFHMYMTVIFGICNTHHPNMSWAMDKRILSLWHIAYTIMLCFQIKITQTIILQNSQYNFVVENQVSGYQIT